MAIIEDDPGLPRTVPPWFRGRLQAALHVALNHGYISLWHFESVDDAPDETCAMIHYFPDN
jgi:hypothetical protein